MEAKEVGDAAHFLLSDMASGITGTTLYVDTGYHIMGTPDAEGIGSRKRKRHLTEPPPEEK